MVNARARPFDVVVVGGSFAGLALSLAFAQSACGLEVALLERRPLESGPPGGVGDPRAFALSGSSRRLLDAIGVWAGVAEAAEPVTGIDITDSALGDAVRPVLLSYDTRVGGEPQMFIVEAERLRAALVAAVLAEPSIRRLPAAGVAGLAQTDGALVVRLADGAEVAGRLVVAADGARSHLRDLAGIGIVGGSYRQRGIATVVSHERDHGGRAVQHFLPGGPFALLPLGGRRCCITWSETEAEAERIMALDDQGFLEAAQGRAGWRLGALALAGPRQSWPLSAHLARSLVSRRLALVGDAARSVHPIAGQGLNLGLRDVAALAESVVEAVRLGFDAGEPTALERYERWRRADGVQSAAAFSALNALFSNDVTLLRTLRDAGLGVVDRLSGLKQLLVSEAAGLTGNVPRLLKGEPL